VETSTISGAASVSEGTEYTLNLQSNETRPTPTSWEITWGDGEVEELDGNPSSATHTFADGDGVFPIVAKTTDEEGTLTSNLLTLTVTNVAPTIALSGGSSVNTGLPLSLSFGQVIDPGQDIISTYNVRWGDGQSNSYNAASPVTHIYDEPGVMSITVDLVDEDGTHPFAGSHSVTVIDVPPTVTLSGADSVNEGEVYSLTLDPGNETFIELVVNWGDGTSNTYTTAGSKNHIYNDGGLDVNITVDMVTGSGTIVGVGSKTVTVNNIPSSISPTAPGTVLEGTEFALTLGAISDTGGNNVTQVIVNWGDGQSDTFDMPFPDEALHTYINGPATRTITVALVDDDGTNIAATLQVSVQDVAPTVGFSGATSVDEGSHYTITVGPVFDPGADVITQLIIHWGDGSPNIFSQTPGDVTHTYADGTTTPTITVDVLDDDGLHLNAGSFSLTVNNVAPTLSLGGPSEVDEGSLYTLTLGNVVDPGSDTISAYLIDWNDGTNPQNIPVASLPASRKVTHTFANGPATPTIRVDLFDEDGNPHVGAGSHSLTVNDVAPTISLSGAESVNEGSLYTLTLGDVIDPGTSDAVTSYVVSWGDGNSDTFNTSSLAVATHTYADGPASHAITVDLVDNDGTHTVPVDIEVSVENVAPTVSISGNAVILEGDLYTLDLDPVVDPGNDTIQGYIVDWGDGKSSTFNTPSLSQATHIYTSGPSAPTITVDLVDEDGTHAAASLSLTEVQGVSPVVALSGALTVNEGGVYTLNFGPVFDPGDVTVFKFVVNWGDGASNTFNTTSLAEATHTYTDGVTNPTITVDLEDLDGLHTGAGTLTGLEVINVAPTIALSGDAGVDEGSPFELTLGAVTDPGNDTVQQFVVHWGDSSSNTYGSNAQQVTHSYADGASFPTISVDVVDEDGTHVGAGSLALTVNNVSPEISLSGNISVNEGSLYSLTLGTVTDPGTDAVIEYIVHWGDDSAAQSFFNTGVVTHTYVDGISNPIITVDLRDEDGTHTGAGILLLAVNNVVPSIALIGGSSANEGSAYTLTMGQITDPGDDTVTRAVVHWGDGRTSNTVPGGSVTHVYSFDFVDQDTATTITVDLVDEDGTHTERGTKTITVVDVNPPFLNSFDLDDDNEKPGGMALTLSPFNLWVVDERDDKVYVYSPTTGALLRSFELTANGHSKGITVDANGFWVLDEEDKTVTRYDMNGVSQISFRVRPRGGHLEGITNDGSSLWIVDKDAGVFRYDFSGNLMQSSSFQLDSRNSHAEGITTDGTSLWVVDRDKDRVFRYSAAAADGEVLDSFIVKPATHPEGITTDGTNIWIVDKDSDRVFRFDVN
jgi:glutamine cyclotransferase